jgi:phosphate transport system permease protein
MRARVPGETNSWLGWATSARSAPWLTSRLRPGEHLIKSPQHSCLTRTLSEPSRFIIGCSLSVHLLPTCRALRFPAIGTADDAEEPARVSMPEAADARMLGQPVPRQVTVNRSLADRTYRGVATAAGLSTFAVLFLIGLFLFLKGLPTLRHEGLSFFTSSTWNAEPGHVHFGVAAVVYWTVVIALIALVLATPVAIATALFITQCAPPGVARVLTSTIDLLAAIPSVIYGVWAVFFLQGHLMGPIAWIARHLAFIPIFQSKTHIFTSSAFIAGIVVAIMILPIVTSITREVFSLTPAGEREGALALGATRWDVIKSVVLPFGRGGMIGALLLGLGRALGETIAIYLIISPIFVISRHILDDGANSVAALITLRFGSGGSQGLSALLFAGFTLFVMTLVVNLAASWIVRRSRSAKGLEL